MTRLALHWQILGGMFIGALVGIVLNAGAGSRDTVVDAKKLPKGVAALTISDTPNRVEIKVTPTKGEYYEVIVDGTGKQKKSFPTVKQLKSKKEKEYKWFKRFGRSTSRTVGDIANQLGGLFLRLLKMVAVPLIITSLMSGILGLGQTSQLGRMFSRTLLYYICTSFLAIVTGLAMVNLIRPGLGDVDRAHEAAPAAGGQTLSEVLFGQIEKMIPTNPVSAVASSEFLSIISFSIAFSVFTVLVGGKVCESIRTLVQSAFEVMMAMTRRPSFLPEVPRK